MLGAIVFALKLPALRVTGRQLLLAQEIAAGDPTVAATEATAATTRKS